MIEFSDELIKDYDADEAANLIHEVADRIIWENGELRYKQVTELAQKKSFTKTDALYFLFACTITSHIPLYVDGQRVERPLIDCVRDTLTFAYTRIDEDEFEAYSKTSTKVPTFKRHDQSDGMFKAGTGNRFADFEAIDDPNIIADMKYIEPTAQTKRSTWHDANKAICKDTKGAGMYSYYNLAADADKKVIINSEIWLTDFIPCDRDFKSIYAAFPVEYRPLIDNIETTIKEINTAVDFYSRNEFKWPN